MKPIWLLVTTLAVLLDSEIEQWAHRWAQPVKVLPVECVHGAMAKADDRYYVCRKSGTWEYLPPYESAPVHCLATMVAAMREHDDVDAAEIALNHEYRYTPEYAIDVAPGTITTCLSLVGNYRCEDDRYWTEVLTDQSLKAREDKLKEDREKLSKRQAWQDAKDKKYQELTERKVAFVQQWAQAKTQCWGKP